MTKPGIKRLPAGILIALSNLAFVSLGLPDGLLGVAWPGMRETFGVRLDALGILMVWSTLGYLVSGFGSSMLLRRLGIGNLLTLSCLLTICFLWGYALSGEWLILWPLAFLGGLGAGGIDAGLNHYVEERFGHAVMQWMHACYGIGVTAGPLIMTFSIAEWNTWRVGFMVAGFVQLMLTLVFFTVRKRWETVRIPTSQRSSSQDKPAPHTSMSESLKSGRIWLSALLFLTYVGVEAGLGVWAFSFLTESKGLATQTSGIWVGAYWASFTMGRIASGFLISKISSTRLLYIGIAGASAGVILLSIDGHPLLPLPGLMLSGLALSPMFAALMSTTSLRVGRSHTSNAIAMQIGFAGLGGGLLPAFTGIVAQQLGLAFVPMWLLLLLSLLLVLIVILHRPATSASDVRSGQP